LLEKIDLVMWTKNGAGTLPSVLKRISEVIPDKFVNNRIVVDDHSSDNTRKIARSFGWTVVPNEGSGISDGANTALKHVTTDRFISFEQDILLASNWWDKIPKLLKKDKVAIASGIRLPDRPLSIRKLQEYVHEGYRKQYVNDESFTKGKSLDNTIYKTKILRKLGGFPVLQVSAGVDTVLAYRVYDAGYRWLVDYDVISTHLRGSLWREIKHYHWYGKCHKGLKEVLGKTRMPSVGRIVLTTLFAPIRGTEIALKKKSLKLTFVYPLIRTAILLGVIRCYLSG